MPFNREQPFQNYGTVSVSEYDTPEPAFLDTLGAAYRQENIIGSSLSDFRRDLSSQEFRRVDREYQTFAPENITGYEKEASEGAFDDVFNKSAHDAVKANIDREKSDRNTLAASGWTGMGLSMAAGVTDLPTLLPGGAFIRAGRVGINALRSGASVGIAAGLGTAAQEAGLQATQELRTGRESAMNIGGSVILGGLLGAGAGKFFSNAEWGRVSKQLEGDLQEVVPNPDEVTQAIVSRMQSAGAAAVDEIKLDDLGIGGPKAAELVARATAAARINPGIETMFSPSKAVRETYVGLVDNPIYTKMNMEGRSLGSDVENSTKLFVRGATGDWVENSRLTYRDARKAGYEGSRTEFNQAVAYAARRGDLDPNGNEFITRMAQYTRQKIFDPLLKQAIELKLLPEDTQVSTAMSYVTRMWNRQKLIGEESRFREIARDYFSNAVKQQVDSLAKAKDSRVGRLQSVIADLELPADQRATLLRTLPEELKILRETNPSFVRVDEELSSLRSQLYRAREASNRTEAEAISAQVDAVTEKAGRDYADYVTKRNALQSRIGRIRNNVVGRASQIEAMRARIGDIEAANIERLRRLHRSLSNVDAELDRASPELLAEKLSKARTQFAQVLERSGNAQDRLKSTLEKIAREKDDIAATPEEVAAGKDAASRGLARDVIADKERASSLRTEFENLSDQMDRAVQEFEQHSARQVEARDRALARGDVGRASDIERKLVNRSAKHDVYVEETSDKLTRMLDEADQLTGVDRDKLVESLLSRNEQRRESLEARMSRAEERFRIAEARRLDEAYDLAARIGDLEKINPEEAIAELRVLIERRLQQASDIVARENAKVIELSKRIDAANPARVTDRIKALQQKITEAELEFNERVFVGMDGQNDFKDYVDDIVTEVFNNLAGRGSGEFPEWIVPVKRGPLKERTFNIPDELVEEFLENDMEAIVRNYTRKMSTEVELTRKFGRADMKDQFDAIEREYADLSKAAKTPEERIKLERARKRDITNLTAFRDMVRGTYRAADNSSDWSKITRAALTWNYVRLLGGVTLTSITDASRLIGVHGVRATMREALPALVKGVTAVKISKADARALGAVTERVLQSRLASLTDLNDPYAYGSRFERFLSNTSNIFSKATGLGYWNDTMKSIASVMTQNRMMRNALNWNGAGDSERAYMAFLGIDEGMAQRIASQFRKYGIEEEGIFGANASMWDDAAAQRVWASALNKDVDRTIITKGVADTPLWTKTNWGRLIFQFKSFGLASHQRVLIAGLQERPQRLAEQMVFASALGMLVSYMKFIERGDYEEAERLTQNPGLWVANGLDRSGVLSIPFEISNTAEKLGYPGLISAAQAIAQDPDQGGSSSRYASRGVAGALGGPTIGTIEDLVTISNQLLAGDLKKSGANAIIRQVPGATLPGIRTAIHVGVKPAFQEAVE